MWIEGNIWRENGVKQRIDNRLCIIELDPEDKIRGNYELIISGPVKHIPNHRYLVTEEQVKRIKDQGIKFQRVDC